jgi:hypothetical protein
METIRPNLTFEDHTEEIYLVNGTGEAYSTRQQAEQQGGLEGIDAVTLHRPSLRPVYGGPTLIEALWAEMDAIMERLMTGQAADDECGQLGYHGVPLPYDNCNDPCQHDDNGDKYRAQELAWVLAIVTNAYDPSVDRIRKEAMERWKAAEREAALQEEALNPDQDDMFSRPEGADQ